MKPSKWNDLKYIFCCCVSDDYLDEVENYEKNKYQREKEEREKEPLLKYKSKSCYFYSESKTTKKNIKENIKENTKKNKVKWMLGVENIE